MPWVFVQASPHPRQSVSVPSWVSQPACILEQSRQPESQVVSVQAPVPHDSLACGRLHATLHPPQSVRVVSDRSQPFDTWLSQLSQPVSQRETAHEPVAQLGVPWAVEQVRPQTPQFTSVLSSVSQPLLRLPSQSPQPTWQLGTQPFVSQLVVPCSFRHASPQVRQLSSVPRRVSQPSAAVQSEKPESHSSSTQPRFTQMPVPFG